MMSTEELKKALDEQREAANGEFLAVTTKGDLDSAKAKYLGSQSVLVANLKDLRNAPQQDKAQLGSLLNRARQSIEGYYSQARSLLNEGNGYSQLDLSRPRGIHVRTKGHMHPTSSVLEKTYEIFAQLGFAIVDSDEIETDWYNFEALNMPADHPAREMQDTFYIKNGTSHLVPRTHTSGMQVRFMENNKPPFKIIVPGRVFRNEDEDITHIWSFYQVEGLVVGEGVTMADLKGTLLAVVQHLLGEDADIRFRASYFPYTEPSVEIDCKYKGEWLELGGAGMVHPQVLRNGGIDPDVYSGFAFGWGAERIANIVYKMSDLRELWRPNLSFLEQF